MSGLYGHVPGQSRIMREGSCTSNDQKQGDGYCKKVDCKLHKSPISYANGTIIAGLYISNSEKMA
jgi:hypothetical protein